MKNIIDNVRKGSTIFSDDMVSYRKLGKLFKHDVVSHGRGEYVRGDVHSNGAESFWALFKRGYHGTYHKMSKKHLQRYVDEFAFRFNNRSSTMSEKFESLVSLVSGYDKMRYKTLTA